MPTLVGGVPVHIADGSLYWIGPAAVDADGSPGAYHLTDDRLGLDTVKNAKNRAGGWVGVVTDTGEPDGTPLLQDSGPFAGYPVSPTSLRDKTRAFKRNDASQYVDATRWPYAAVPPELRALGVSFGDVGFAVRRGGACTWLIVADGGPHNALGEVSISAADRLCFPSSPRDGGLGGHNLLTVVFPKSHLEPRWPRTEEDLAAQAAELFGQWGGLARALALLA